MDHYRDDQSTLRSSGSVSGSRSRIPDDDMDMEEKENLLESGGIRTHSPPPKSQKNQRRSKLAILSLPCTTFFLALSNVLLLAALVAVTLRPMTTTITGTATTPAGATPAAKKFPEQPPWEPQVDFRTEIFRFQTIYGAEPSDEVDQAWTAMIPSKFLATGPKNLADYPGSGT